MRQHLLFRLGVALSLVIILIAGQSGIGLAASLPSGANHQLTNSTSVLAPTADPVVDGLLDGNYVWLEHFTKGPDSGNTTLAPGDMYGYEGASVCYWAFVVDRAFNDNVYAPKQKDGGTQADLDYLLQDGWTVDHDFSKLHKSDHAIFGISGPSGTYTVTLDLLHEVTLGVDYTSGITGHDKSDLGTTPDNQYVNEAATSLFWNVYNSNWSDFVNRSPAYDYNTTSGEYWEWQIIYEWSMLKSDLANLGLSDCGSVTQGGAHNSPNKNNESLASIGDYVWNDANGNGLQDDGGGAAGLGNVTLLLKDDQGVTIRTTQTSSAGAYFFNNLAAGTYTVDVDETTLPAGSWTLTTPPEPRTLTLTAGEQRLDIDFGYTLGNPGLTITKSFNGVEPVAVGQALSYTILITNTGDTTIDLLPLQDLYDNTVLTYLGANPASDDNTDDGVIDWSDLTVSFGNDLAPGQTFTVTVNFQAVTATSTTGFSLDASQPVGSALAQSSRPASVDDDENGGNSPYCKCDGGISRLVVTYRDPGGHPLVDITLSGNVTPTSFTNIADGDVLEIFGTGNNGKMSSSISFALSDAGTSNNFQTVDVHTSCSQPIGPGQMWGTPGAIEILVVDSLNGWKSCPLGSIGDRIFDDLDHSGLPDGGVEPGLNGVTVELYGGLCPIESGGLISTLTSSGNGNYDFTNLPPGDYCVNVDDSTAPTAYSLTTGNDPLSVTLAKGADYNDADFGYAAQTGSIGDRVFYDLNGDGLPDNDGDPGLNGVTVNLYQGACPPAGNIIQTQTTSGNGNYDFTNLVPNTYCVDVDESTLPAGAALTTANEPHEVTLQANQDYNDADFGYRVTEQNKTCDVATASGVDVHGGSAAAVSASACTQITNKGSIGDRVWYDKNSDAVQDAGEAGLKGVTVNLRQGTCTGAIIASQTTGIDGIYLFDNLDAGAYCVEVDETTLPADGMNNTTANNPLLVTLSAGQDKLDADFGYVATTCLPNIDFETDAYGNALVPGQIIDDEWAPWGITVTTQDPNNHPAMIFDSAAPSGGDTDLGTPNQDFSGPGVGAGGGSGMPGENSQAQGQILIISQAANQADPNNDANAGTLTFTFDHPVEVDILDVLDVDGGEVGGTVKAYDAGSTEIASIGLLGLGDNSFQSANLQAINASSVNVNFAASAGLSGIRFCDTSISSAPVLGDFIWDDQDADGVQDVGEPGIANVELELYIDGFNYVVDTATTNGLGIYNFVNVPDGNYIVKLAASNFTSGGPLDGWIYSPKDVTTSPPDLFDSDFDSNTASASATISGGLSNLTVDGGFHLPLGSIGDFVFMDSNGNGLQDAGETSGVPNVQVTITNLSTSVQVQATTTVTGYYRVDNLPSGSYQVEVPTSLPGLTRTTPPMTVNLLPGQVITTADFGYIPPTMVELVEFSASATKNGVQVTWRTASETNQEGFVVWRAMQADGPYKPVSGLIPASNDPLGASYSWMDSSVSPTGVYWYQIESAPDGQMFGPVTVQPGPEGGSLLTFIPFMLH